MDIDDPAAHFAEERVAEDLPVSGHHDQVEVAFQEFELCGLRCFFGVFGDGDMNERNVLSANFVGEVGMVGDHKSNVDGQFSSSRSPKEIEEAVVISRHHDYDAPVLGGCRERPLHVNGLGDFGSEVVQDSLFHT